MPIVVLLLVAIGASLFLRVNQKKRTQAHQVPEHAKPSPFSQSLQELIATAGGIYLSLVLLVAFLQLEITEHFSVYKVSIDPLAFASLSLAVVQPIILQIFSKFKKK